MSEGAVKALVDIDGKEMCVIGEEDGEGSCRSDENVLQYFCSGVRGEGPVGSLTRVRGSTSAAIFAEFAAVEVEQFANQEVVECRNHLLALQFTIEQGFAIYKT